EAPPDDPRARAAGAGEGPDEASSQASTEATGPDRFGPDPSAVLLEAPGEEEVAVVGWPLLWRQRREGRRAARAEAEDRAPWRAPAGAPRGLFSVGLSITVLSIAVTGTAREFATADNVAIWVITGPLLLGAIVAPAAGKLAALVGAPRVYLTAMGLVALF